MKHIKLYEDFVNESKLNENQKWIVFLPIKKDGIVDIDSDQFGVYTDQEYDKYAPFDVYGGPDYTTSLSFPDKKKAQEFADLVKKAKGDMKSSAYAKATEFESKNKINQTNEATKLDLKNDIFDSGLGGYKDWSFDPAKKKLTVTYDIGKWDNKGRYEKEIKWLATNDRSAMTSGNSLVGHLDLYLEPHGLEVDKKKQHKYDAAKGRVELNLTDANPDNHWYGHSVWENDEAQTNEASTPGRAWSGALSNVDKLFAWMYDNGILSKSEKAEKDRIFSQYYRWYNDGDFPAALRSMGVSKSDRAEVIEKALEELVEKFMKEVLNKYTGKYDRKEFHIDTLLADLNTLENIVAGYQDPNGRGEPDPYGLLNYWGKKINTGNSDFEKLLGELGPLYKDVSDSTNKAFDAAGENIGSSYTIAYRRELAKGKGVWTPELEKKYMKMKNHMLRMHNILKKVIEATQRARVAILDRQGISKY